LQANLTHPKGKIRNKITLELSDADLDMLRAMDKDSSYSIILGYAAIIVIKKKETENGREGLQDIQG
jgi:hypothetical protein